MSLDVLTAIWRDPPCKGGDLLCLLAIADNADENGYAWPSVTTIARKASMSQRGAQKCLKKLHEAGLISIISGGGRNKTNAYQITTNGIGDTEKRKNPEQNTVNPSSPFSEINPEQRDINPEQSCTKPRTPVHPNSQEPSKNHCVSGKADTHTQFEKFWELHPRPKDREVSQTRFLAAIEAGADVRDILYGAQAYASEQKGNGKQYICGSDAWLFDKRWADFVRPAEITPQDKADLIRKMKASKNPAVRAHAEKMEAAE